MFGVSAKQCRDHPEKGFPPTNVEFLPKALRNPKVKFAKSRSRFGDYIKWSDITTVLLEIVFGVSAKQVCKLDKSILRLHKMFLHDESTAGKKGCVREEYLGGVVGGGGAYYYYYYYSCYYYYYYYYFYYYYYYDDDYGAPLPFARASLEELRFDCVSWNLF